MIMLIILVKFIYIAMIMSCMFMILFSSFCSFIFLSSHDELFHDVTYLSLSLSSVVMQRLIYLVHQVFLDSSSHLFELRFILTTIYCMLIKNAAIFKLKATMNDLPY